MSQQVEFFFDYGSPFSYLADTQLAALAQRTGATIVYWPMLLGAVLKATGNASPIAVPAKGRYMGVELQRWAKHYGVPFVTNRFFPINTMQLMREAVAAQQADCFAEYHRAICPHRRARRQRTATAEHRGGCAPGSVWCANVLCRRRNVLGE